MQVKSEQKVVNLPVYQLQRGRYQTRAAFDETELKELAASITQHGIIQPILVKPISAELFEIIAGERRWRAAQLAGLDTVPCLVQQCDQETMAAVTTIENLQRKDLNPIEEAQAFETMVDEFSYQHDEVASLVGKSRTYISNALRLLSLDKRVQSLLVEGQLSGGQAKVICGVSKLQQFSVAEECVKNNWSVRQLEKQLQKLKEPPLTQTSGIRHNNQPDISRLERLVEEQVGAPVKLESSENDAGGWFKIKFYDSETLAGLLDKMGIEYE